MGLNERIDELMPSIMEGMESCRECPLSARTGKRLDLAGQKEVHQVVEDIISMLFPGCHSVQKVPEGELKPFVEIKLKSVAARLRSQIEQAYEYQCAKDKCTDCGECGKKADDAVLALLAGIPAIQETLRQDIVAAYEGDPAAQSTMEVVMSYPGLYATIVHRIAHVLYSNKVPLIPRMMSEYSHSKTGIDIHPGAKIGPGFFIDHGTGVVIGETCVIGKRVKLYQGVTLGALSFEKDAQGNPVKGVKRHPEVEDNAVIYAGATILGGQTKIGEGSEIGGNVWLTHSVPPHSKVYNQQPEPLIKPKKPKA